MTAEHPRRKEKEVKAARAPSKAEEAIEEKRQRALGSAVISNYPYFIDTSVYLHFEEVPVMRIPPESKKQTPFTDGTTIFLPDAVHSANKSLYKSLVIRTIHAHELAHIDLDSDALNRSIAERLRETGRIDYKERPKEDPRWHKYHDILNIIEDGRIEHLFGYQHRGIGVEFRLNNEVAGYYIPRKHEAVGRGKQKISSLEEQAAQKGIDPDPLYFEIELVGLAIVGRTFEPLEPDHEELFMRLMPKIQEYQSIRPPMIKKTKKIDQSSSEFKRLNDLYIEILEDIESKYPPKKLEEMMQNHPPPDPNSKAVSEPTPFNDPNTIPEGGVDKAIEKIKQGQFSDSNQSPEQQGVTPEELICPSCGGVIPR
jgi:hypothetical protein